MITLGINENNDLYLNGSNLAIKNDKAALGDIYINKVQTLKGEIVYNTEKGIDYFNTVFCEPIYPDVFQNQVKNEILDTEETQSIISYSQNITDGILNYKAVCQTSYGEITING